MTAQKRARREAKMRAAKTFVGCLTVILVLLLAHTASVDASGPYTKSFPASTLFFGEESGYDSVGLGNCHLMTELGKPRLPVSYVRLIIPAGMDVDSVVIVSESHEGIEGTYNIIPAQHPIPSNGEPPPEFVEPDSAVYVSGSPFPGKLAEPITHGYFDGANRIATLALYPLQYVPATGELTLYTSITFDINLVTSEGQPIYPAIRLRHLQTVYDNVLTHLVDNPEDIPLHGYTPELVDTFNLTGGDTGAITTYGRAYELVSEDSLVDYFDEFAEWMTRKGVPTIVQRRSLINDCFSGDEVSGIYDEPGKIREYVRWGYESCGVTYALLSGFSSGAFQEGDIVPARIGACGCHKVADDPWPPGDAKMIPADFYFSEFNGDWNVDLDEYYGETPGFHCEGDAVEYEPEMFVGRIPSSNGEEILNWTRKVLQYEQDPGNGDYTYLTRAYWNQADQSQSGQEAQRAQPYYPSYFSHDLTEEYPSYDHPDPTSPFGAEVISEMGQGYGMVNWNHHGNCKSALVRTDGCNAPGGDSWRVTTFDAYQLPCVSEVGNGLDNLPITDRYFVLDATDCYTAAYDEAHHLGAVSLAEGSLLLADRGAVAYLGNTRNGYFGMSNGDRVEFLKKLFGHDGAVPIYNIGACHAASLPTAAGYGAFTRNLFGSPEMPIWTDTPQKLNVLIDFEDDYILVRDESGQPIEGALVCLTIGHNWHQCYGEVQTTSVSGTAHFTCGMIPEICYVVATKPNFIPFSYYPCGCHVGVDTTWQGTVYLDGDVIVDRGVTLTLLPNTTVRFAAQDAYKSGFDRKKCELIVAGNLVAVGSQTDTIRFLSEGGAYDSWRGITVLSIGNAQLQYCLVEDAHVGLALEDTSHDEVCFSRFHNNVCGIRSRNGNAHVYNNRILSDDLGDYGIHLDCVATYPPGGIAVENNTIENYKYGIYAFNCQTHIRGNHVHGSSGAGSIIGIYCLDCDEVTVACNDIGSGSFSDCYIKAHQSTLHISDCYFNSWPYAYVPRGIVYDQSTGSVRRSSLTRYSIIGIDCYKSDPDLGREDYAGNNAIFRYSSKGDYESIIDVRNYGSKGPEPTVISAKKNRWGTFLLPLSPVVVGEVDWEPYLTIWPDYPDCDAMPDSQPIKQQSDSEALPKQFTLFQNHPNPFNPQTEMNYALPFDCHVTLTVYNILGQKVITLIDKFQNAGRKTLHWDGRSQNGDELSSGIYFYRIQAGDFAQTRKMLLVK